MSIILGINAFHADSSACLVIDGELIAAIAEERLGNRIKHDPSFPYLAIKKVLEIGGVKLSDVTHLAIARKVSANLGAKMLYTIKNPIDTIPAINLFLKRFNRTENIWNTLAENLGESPDRMRFKIVNVEHHLAHIASAYYLSPFESLTAGISYDGSGDFVSMMAARCEGNKIKVLDKVTLPLSLGSYYTAICQIIGFDRFGEEYKVMGLAPYGNDNFRNEMAEILQLNESGWFSFGKKCVLMPNEHESGKLDSNGYVRVPRLYDSNMIKLLGEPRDRNSPITQREKDIAKSCQIRFEETAIHCMNSLHKMVPVSQLVMAGGSALNGVANARILRDTPFTKSYLQAAASDEGTSLGAAYWCYHNVVNGKKRFYMKHAFWGGEYTDGIIKSAIIDKKLDFIYLKDADLINKMVQLLLDGNVIGWYQGRSEWGPRALGNRSILADPTNPNMKEIINAKIKRRESFRPFAPSVLAEKVNEYFEQDVFSPFMMHVVKFKQEWRGRLPAVTHVDGTGRLQSVRRDENPLYYDLIKQFGDTSGVYILLNTSFNENEPVVETPEQALDCYLRTDMDAICLGNYLIMKR